MPELVSELLVSLDMCARGMRSPGYYGYLGPDFAKWLSNNNAKPHRTLIGRKTYEMLNSLPEEARDEGWRKMREAPSFLFSRSLTKVDWPGVELVQSDMFEFVSALKSDGGSELRTLGSLSLSRQFAAAGLLDRIRFSVCPIVVPETGVEPVFQGWPDQGFELVSTKVLDGRIHVLEYALAGAPPST